jgi:SAM-dependent methyltransferase
VTELALPDASVDAIVSFETIEHLPAQREMLAEFRRVLAPSGMLVISSPNRPVYNEGGAIENHFHVKELDRAELKALLDPGFPQQAWYAQSVLAQSALWAQGEGAQGTQFLKLPGDRDECDIDCDGRVRIFVNEFVGCHEDVFVATSLVRQRRETHPSMAYWAGRINQNLFSR